MSCTFSPTETTRLRFNAELGTYDADTIFDIIDSAPMCHVSATANGRPYIQATVHWRKGNKVYMHGTVKNKMVKAIADGAEACLCFDHFDGYVMTRSAFNHVVLYRSVVAFSKGRAITDLDEKRAALKAYMESIEVGRWDKVRQPTEEELKMTGIIEFELDEVSAKVIPQEAAPVVLPGGDYEIEDDANYSPWTGVVPYTLVREKAISSEDC